MFGRHMDEMSMVMGDGTRVIAKRFVLKDEPSRKAYSVSYGQSYVGTIILCADGWEVINACGDRWGGENVPYFDDAFDMLVRWERERRGIGS